MKKQQRMLSNVEISSFCEQMAMILKSGVSILEGLSIMLEDAPPGEGQGILSDLYQAFGQYGQLAPSLEAAKVFPAYMVGMVRLGETAGRLDAVMDALILYYGREEDIARGIRSAISYPLIMIGMMLVIVVVLMVNVMPVFAQVFAQLGAEMTGFSRAILEMGLSMNRYAAVFVVLLILLLATIFYLCKVPRGRAAMARFASKFFLTRKLNEKIALARFASGLSMTIASGLDGEHSLCLVADITENPALKKKIAVAQTLMAKGCSFPDALHEAALFSGIYGKILAIGHKSGTLDKAMDRIAGQYNDEVDTAINGMLAVLEPTLVAILSIIVGIILLSVMFPLLGIMSTIG
ncbi:type II secretion system F family protein [Eubacterium sp.]|uniref:type II secretion system F family protein n=1 Tax=Eubacterium sp. TaxID=142586 RepID=UPI002FC6E89A